MSPEKGKYTRRNFIKVAGVFGGTMMIGGSLWGCAQSDNSNNDQAGANSDVSAGSWEEILEAANGQTVSFYGWGGDELRNKWLDTVVAESLKTKYEITLNRVPMDINDILTKLSGEMQAGQGEGSIDVIWINGENFFSAKQNGFLWGPFSEDLPNYQSYIDGEDVEMAYDFGEKVEGYEAPYGKAQMQMWVDSETISERPKTPEEFLSFCETYSGKVTYPTPGDFMGTAFVECLIAGVIGREEFEKLSTMEADIEKVKEVIAPGLEYLKSLNPHLWNKGTTFPADSGTVNQMFADKELVLSMGYTSPQADMDAGTIPQTVRSFVFETGTVGNTNFMGIANNSIHKAGAQVVINEIMSPEIQLTQYEDLHALTVLDIDKLSAEQQQAFTDVEQGPADLSTEELLTHRLPEAPGPIVPLIEKLWLQEVVGQ